MVTKEFQHQWAKLIVAKDHEGVDDPLDEDDGGSHDRGCVMTSSNTARPRRSPIMEDWRLQAEETKSETVNTLRPEAGPHGDAPRSALEREATGATVPEVVITSRAKTAVIPKVVRLRRLFLRVRMDFIVCSSFSRLAGVAGMNVPVSDLLHRLDMFAGSESLHTGK